MPVYIQNIDIFHTPESVPITHCVSLCFSMTKGLATDVRARYGGRERLWSHPTPRIGGLGIISGQGRIIINLVTKHRKSDLPTMNALLSCLDTLRDFCLARNITLLAMPFNMAAGLDRLHWPTVLRAIRERFERSPVTVVICKKPLA